MSAFIRWEAPEAHHSFRTDARDGTVLCGRNLHGETAVILTLRDGKLRVEIVESFDIIPRGEIEAGVQMLRGADAEWRRTLP